ncbi:hypothetical protein [Tardiphaga sp. P9-11]|uniref:hypothetical protein n=1 Tax=Tardiphaga sp. P9-11 TaxID=2024614 RepID=UPI0011F2A5F3|nr:hypothetical protein [Tardiphaga sp. P9-11]KAA0069979.1 hypothetical protein CIW50_27820 [Tardiphaga sp. P9-11]
MRSYIASHPSIETVLKWSASPLLATMALARAIHGGKRAQLAFMALAAGSMVCFVALLWETRRGMLGDEVSMILTVMSSIAWAAVPVLLLFRVNTDNLVTYAIAALTGSGGGFYYLVQHASKPLDEVASTAAATLAAAGVVAWSRQTGLWRMALMAGAWAMIIVPQYAVHDGDAVLMDMARFGALIVALLLVTTGIDADKDDKDERDELKGSVSDSKPANSNVVDDLQEAA